MWFAGDPGIQAPQEHKTGMCFGSSWGDYRRGARALPGLCLCWSCDAVSCPHSGFQRQRGACLCAVGGILAEVCRFSEGVRSMFPPW